MDKFFLTILINTLVASWIILAVIILRLAFRMFIKKVPKWINCLLWGLVAIRLVFPFSIESIFSLIPSAKPVPVDIEYAKVPQIDSGITVVNTAINPILENNFAAEEVASANPIQIVIGVASYLWIFGVIALFIYAFVSFILIKRRVKNAQLVDKGIFRVETLDSPFILGILRPSVYIPDSLDEEAYQCVIEHEKAHIKRGDFIWKPLGFLILSVYWFNPLCWISYICLCKDIEYACDEKVTYDKDKEWKAKYCQTLLNCSSQRRLISACPVAFGEVSVKDRIKSVINYKKPGFWIVCISLITAIIIAICFLTNPKAEENDTNSIVGRYIKSIVEEDKLFYTSELSINEDGTFAYSPSLISSYMGIGTWEINQDHIIFYDIGMGDRRKEVFLYNDGKLYYVANESASNSMWQLEDGAEYILVPDDYDLFSDVVEINDNQDLTEDISKEDGAEVIDTEKNNIEEPDVDDSESAEWEYPRLIRVNGYLFYDCAEISTELRCGMMDGTIDSVCDGDIPSEDNQSNFGSGYNYQYGADTIEVSIDDEWHIFKKIDYDEWNILPEYVYYGDDPIEKAIIEYYLSNNYHYEMKPSVAIPAFCIFMSEVDETNADIVKVYGNYWVFVYEKNGTTLECISGGEAPGVMYVKRNGDEYVVDHFEQVRDGSYYAEDIKKICNGNKSLEDQYYNYSEFMTTTRIYNIKKYVEMFDLDIDSYHDYGWDTVMLSDYSFDGIEEVKRVK